MPADSKTAPFALRLAPGESVAAAGAFLIDAETRLNPAAGALYFGGGGTRSAPEPAPKGAEGPRT